MSISTSVDGAPVDRSIDELDAAICRLSRQMNSQTYRLLLLVREFDDRLGWSKWSFRCCAEWLAWRCGVSLSAAREKVRTAQALRRLPAVSAAFADGRLSYSKVRALTRAADVCDEDLLLAYALEATAAQVEDRCRELRNVAPTSVDVARRAWERRSMSIWRDAAAGTMRITIEVPVEEGELIAHAVDRAVEAGEAAGGPEFAAAGWHAQQADALVAVAKAYLGGERVGAPVDQSRGNAAEGASDGGSDGRSCGGASADHYQVVVHVDAAALRGGAGRSDLPIETVRRLTCDGSLVTVLDDEGGSPLRVGRKHRAVLAPLRRAIWARDRGCSFPGCERTHYVDIHHVRHWADGGDTSLENLTLLCSHHHRLLHEGGFRIRRDHEGSIYFQRADGRVIPRRGYRLEDTLDDDALSEADCPEFWLSAIVGTRKPSAEVREPRPAYHVVRRGVEHSKSARAFALGIRSG